MGTNFYWANATKRAIDDDDPKAHIGKRSAAGLFCWDCNQTLCPGGSNRVHYHDGLPWPKTCPQCGRTQAKENVLEEGPAAVELGFAKPRMARPTGVRGAASFSWAQDPKRARTRCRRYADRPVVVDEYGRHLTGQEFLDMLEANCPLEYTHSMGVYFC